MSGNPVTWTDIGVIVALIGLLITFIGVIINFIVIFINNKQTRLNLEKTRFTSIVVLERNKWLEMIRQDFSRFIGLTKYIIFRNNAIATMEESKEIFILVNMLKLRLNPSEDKELIQVIDQFQIAVVSHEHSLMSEYSNEIIYLLQNILKKEWEKVKLESKHGIEIK